MTSWIKMGTGLASHGKVKALRRALKGDRLKVIGGLWAVWCVFDEHSAGGVLSGYTLDDMDEEIGWKGFAAAMRDIGWLIETDDGLEAPDYEEHNGPNAKRRALDASRKGKSRAKEDSEPEPTPPPVPQSVRDVSASDADNLRNREDKRREENGEEGEKAPQAPAAVAATPSRPERGTRLPVGWLPGPEQTAFAESLGIRNGVAAAELEKFRDYWTALPGQKGVKTDWTATWRNWLRRKAEDMGGKPGASGGDIFAGAE